MLLLRTQNKPGSKLNPLVLLNLCKGIVGGGCVRLGHALAARPGQRNGCLRWLVKDLAPVGSEYGSEAPEQNALD